MDVRGGVRVIGVLAMLAAGLVGGAWAARADLPPPPPPHGPWKSVSAGLQHTCAINVDDSLYCWGRNASAQTGTGATSETQGALYRVGAAGVWSTVSAGGYHTCGITKAANLYCWGNNLYAQVGDGTTATPRLSLYRVGAAGVWSAVSAGNYHTCGITKAANLYCWGNNDSGQTGDGSTWTPRLGLYRVGAAGVWSGVDAGGQGHTCGITKAANLYCWGYNSRGQIGDGSDASPRLSLYRVGAAGVWSGVDAGYLHTCGRTTAANLYCWGYNSLGQTGDGTTESPRLSLYRVGAAGVWSPFSAGSYHTCGITKAANLYCWGNNSSGQTGDGTADTPRLSLYRVAAAGVWSQISAGGDHTCGITTANNLYCWGNNEYSQIGDDDPVSLGIFYQNPRLTLWRVR